MSTINNGGPAFPIVGEHGPRLENAEGLSIRDHFAGLALQGLLSDHNLDATPENLALASYKLADAMLAERSKGVQG